MQSIDTKVLVRHDLSNRKPVFIIGVPKYHERLYKHIENAHEWLSDTNGINNKKYSGKKINNKEDFDKLQNLIMALRTEKSELFLDEDYHPKPSGQTIASYIQDFLKTKGIHTQYTFTHYYRVTVFPFGTKDFDEYVRTVTKEEDARGEYLIVPLLIRLKRGKTFEQSKMVVGLDRDGKVIVQDVNPKHFYKEREEPVDEDSDIEEERRAKMEFLTT